jgi:hypothetical protein
LTERFATAGSEPEVKKGGSDAFRALPLEEEEGVDTER